MYLEQGKYYECIKELAYSWDVGEKYLAVTSHQLLDKYAVPSDVGHWESELFDTYFKLVDNEKKLKQLLEEEKRELADKILPLIVEFENKTGFKVKEISSCEEYLWVFGDGDNWVKRKLIVETD